MPPKEHACIMTDRIENLEAAVSETREGQSKILEALTGIGTQVALARQAIVGNGVKGLADRMLDQEAMTAKIVEHSVTPEKVKEIAHATVQAVIENARHRDRTTIAKLKALGPWAIPGVMLFIWVLSNLLHWGMPALPGVTQ